MNNLVTLKQAKDLRSLGFVGPTVNYAYRFSKDEEYILQKRELLGLVKYNRKENSNILCIPTVDEAIEFINRKFHVMIYDRHPPFVYDGKIQYGFGVKHCHVKRGWNFRTTIGETKSSTNLYAAKRMAICMAIRFILKRKKDGSSKKR